MVILLNGKNRTLPDKSTAADLIEELQLTGRRIAIEINLEIVSRSGYETHLLHDGDKVEIVHAIGGG
ncbi:MAG: sulfur carrier protein ThiS [Gammaproteobacteria bacterium]|uniref:Sulfur carrier protein ThiS n=1 Tax=Candidatus Thiopontia autotrophica TaxID=2841688 RepID=A0A8J6NX21_9GAMM|nr:sulfur carrier protein ThiS [Candidatus Thiopontia autotrophica]MBL6969244.1 sulfur carrier protein ThiS [Gammaproteobacteria bacterium]